MTATMPDLAGFTGGGDQYEHWTKRIRFTEGVKHLADQVGAYWLIDAIASHQGPKVDRACGHMQCWYLEVSDDRTAGLSCHRDSGEPACVRQSIEFTDFPVTGEAEPLRLWVVDRVLMLPSEY